MKLLKYETFKIFGGRYTSRLLVLLIIANIILCANFCIDNAVAEHIVSADEYSDRIELVLQNAKRQLIGYDSMGHSKDGYAYLYQLKVIELYSELLDNVAFFDTEISGWDVLLEYNAMDIFILISVLIIASSGFPAEISCGTYSIICTCKRGRAHTAVAKLVAGVLGSIGVAAAYIISTWLTVAVMTGFCGGDAPLQSLTGFVLAPESISLGATFLKSAMVKLIGVASFSALILLVSKLCYSHIISYFAGFFVGGVSYVLYSVKFINASSPLRLLNLISFLDWDLLEQRYYGVNLFGSAADGQLTAIVLYFSLAIVFGIGVVVVPSLHKSTTTVRHNIWRVTKAKIADLHERLVIPRRRRYMSNSVASFELYKLLRGGLLIIVVIFAVAQGFTSNYYVGAYGSRDQYYHQMMLTLGGEYTPEKADYIAKERQKINEVMSRYNEIQAKYEAGELGELEYNLYLNEYLGAQQLSEYLHEIEKQQRYLDKLKNERGITGWFVYDTGWMKLFDYDGGIGVILSIFIVFCGVFCREYGNSAAFERKSNVGFAQILRCTKNGREATWRAKIFTAIPISLAISLLYTATEFWMVASRYELGGWGAPIMSLPAFESLDSSMTVVQFVVSVTAIRAMATVLLTLIVVGLSAVCRNNVSVCATSTLIVFAPKIFTLLGISFFKYLDYTKLISGFALCRMSFELNHDFILLILSIIATMSIAGALCLWAHKKWVH